VASAVWGPIGSRLGVLTGVVASFAVIAATFSSLTAEPTKAGGSGAPPIAAHFPFINCLWGPLSLVAGAAVYSAVSSIAAAPLFVPPLRLELSAFPELVTTLDKALVASWIGITIAATLAFLAALVRERRGGLTVSGIAWAPVLASTLPFFMLVFGISHLAHITFAATAVTLAGIPCFIRANDEAASTPAAGRVIFFVLEAVYVSFLSALAAVVVIEFIISRDGIGYAILNAMQLFDPAKVVDAIALVWLSVALLSFIVRCTQSIATRG
jgi:ABC-type nitrate/sulfonate/bicarbonate transport system permease component